ncbi:uncharacterized protein LOC113352551 [Papaver somniferum]|uniref:uncharacterized protein LOC113352551 n=1 Tax=Papaver somniferum TaxID=3469 RepID=UPI000E6F4E18|nr:uncharacterized protein LOC113352551 [Papaver somniferum]
MSNEHESLITAATWSLDKHVPSHNIIGYTSLFVQRKGKRLTIVIAKPCLSPVDDNAQLLPSDVSLLTNPTDYRSLVGEMYYLTWTRPEISFDVNKVYQFMSAPTDIHLVAAKHILRHIKGTLDQLCFTNDCLSLTGFSDEDWDDVLSDSHSISGLCLYFGSNPVSWCAKKQPTFSRSFTESEYQALVVAS